MAKSGGDPAPQDEDDHAMDVEEEEESKAMDVQEEVEEENPAGDEDDEEEEGDAHQDDDEEDEELQVDDDDEDEDEEDSDNVRRSGRSRRQPDRLAGGSKKSSRKGGRTNYAEDDEDVSSSDNEEEKNDDDDDDFDAPAKSRRTARRGRSSSMEVDEYSEDEPQGTRRSSRSTKNQRNMKEPTDSVNDLFEGTKTSATIAAYNNNKHSSKKKASKSSDDDDEDFGATQPPSPESPSKVRGRHSRNRRKSRSVLEDVNDDSDDATGKGSKKKSYKDDDDDYMEEDDYYSESDEEEMEEDDDEDDETMKIQRILASRSETRKRWKEICGKMNSSEVTDGSRWFQGNNKSSEEDDEVIEERFLVKWNGLSYLHVTWETQQDLLDQVENAKGYMSTFFRKSTNGILFTQDERKDGDYFDPGCVEIDRILEITPPDGYRGKLPTSWEEELDVDPIKEYDVVMDKKSKAFESGVGRQFLLKYSSLNYSEASYEFERDLMLMDVDFRDKLKEYYERTSKPSKSEISSYKKKGEEAKRRAYLLFGDNANMNEEEKQAQVAEYQQQLQEHVYENGGQLRDYQAEGVTWFLSNYVNKRSCIMADEMGLGKTLQTAAFIHLLISKMYIKGPFLICVPLSTIVHWQREFVGWTGLNTIVYHGSAVDRQRIRENEFAFERDRPDSVGVNSKYLKKCTPSRTGGPWMATVVVTTPEILVAEDWTELTFVKWQCLVVDEAHRLKNHNSKLAVNLRDDRFKFQHKLLLTGTPIQNDVKEFWTLLNFIDPKSYDDMDEFLESYGDIKSKEKVDELHGAIRPYILRRLKEDVEKSVPPKEETLIEVELTIAQKQYYRALYEKNVGFLHKGKKKALDGPSLNNLAMQLRKCCNHLFLLNGVEEDLREKEPEDVDEGDFVTKASGKLVLLDKLLPRLKQDGHRILLFSQFKIMLDILEDYLDARDFKFERIDGSITGHKRQSAIDRFQDPTSKDPPFVMLLSTRAGGVGINLTAADTCVIFDSDWNPQNDIQAMARCHRIGQTKNVKVYRLLTRKTYEMQMFHLSSMKMGLDQAVLTGFESGATGEGAMTKEEIENLLRHGAYDIFNEDKAGTSERESNDFVEQDIDSILARRSRKVVHENTGTGSAAAGGTFSKASFVSKTPSKGSGQAATEDIDINDPEFWSKVVGEEKPEAESILKPRQRKKADYNEDKSFRKAMLDYGSDSDSSDDSDDSEEDPDSANQERYRWGGQKPDHWKRNQAQAVVDELEHLGYGNREWDSFMADLPKDCKKFSETEVCRMAWSCALMAICESASSEAVAVAKRHKTREDRKRESSDNPASESVLADVNTPAVPSKPESQVKEETFQKVWRKQSDWAAKALKDAIAFATTHEGRSADAATQQQDVINGVFYDQLWPALQARQWKADDDEDEVFIYNDQRFKSPSAVMNEVIRIHPELANMVIPLLQKVEQSRLQVTEFENSIRAKDLAVTASNVTLKSLEGLLERYSPMQLVYDRKRKGNKISLGRKLLSSCHYVCNATVLFDAATKKDANDESDSRELEDFDKLTKLLITDGRTSLPHPLWTKQHDARLVSAIAVHGWCDIDRNMKYIIKDSSIKWGYPFEAVQDEPVQRMGRTELQNLKNTAERAANVLNTHGETFNVVEEFNKNLVVESYGLTHHDVDGSEEKDDGKTWRVDIGLLNQSSKKNDGQEEAADLPLKKDLVKRAKAVIEKSYSTLKTGGVKAALAANAAAEKAKEDSKVLESHGYAVIDQTNRCNILLAELVSALVKVPSKHRKEMMTLFDVVIEEGSALEAMVTPHEAVMKIEVEAMRKIVEQLKLARLACKTAMRQGKNVLRCMVGQPPHPTRYETESQFPDANALKSADGKKAAVKKKVKKNDPSLGEKALLNATKKASKKNSETPGTVCRFGNLTTEMNALGLPLSMVEVYMLTIFCQKGVPLVTTSSTEASELASPLTWKDAATALEQLARQQLQGANDLVEECKKAVDRAKDQGHKADGIALLETKLSMAKSDKAARETAAANTADIIADPVGVLGKKSALLLERIRQHAGFAHGNFGSKASHKYENYLGPKVLSWFGKQIREFAIASDLIADDGKVYAHVTTDLVKEHPEKVSEMAISAFLDKKSARDVISQTAMMTRLRSVLLRNSEAGLRTKLVQAMKNSKKSEDSWEKRPEWWDDTSVQHSYLLLKRLDEYDFSRIMFVDKARDGFGASSEDYNDMKDMQLTKPSIQIRANQLVRELNFLEDHEDTLQLLERRKEKSRNSMDSLAACNGNGSTTPAAKKNTVQMGLKAFFSAGPPKSSSSKKSKQSSGSKTPQNENDRNGGAVGGASNSTGSPDSLASIGKRKESPAQESETNSAEKKAKIAEPQDDVVDLS